MIQIHMKILAGALILFLNLPGLLVHAAAIGTINVTSDLSASVIQRNIGYSLQSYQSAPENIDFQIPDYVLPPRDGNVPAFGSGGIQHPEVGGLALETMFSAQQIWDAMARGYLHLQLASGSLSVYDRIVTRDEYGPFASANWPRWVDAPATIFPNEFRPEQANLFDDAGWQYNGFDPWAPGERVFTYPLSYQGVYDGTFAPGNYRVVFNQDGQYLGVVRIRQAFNNFRTLPLPGDSGSGGKAYARMGWCGATDVNGNPTAKQSGRNGRTVWNYNGSPTTRSATSQFWRSPFNWQRAATLGGIYAGISFTAPKSYAQTLAYETAHNGTITTAPWSNSHPANEDTTWLGCSSGQEYVNQTYQSSCWSHWVSPSSQMDYRITLTGTGQAADDGWCKGIVDNIKGQCGGNFNLLGNYKCDVANQGTIAMYHDWTQNAVDVSTIKYVWGIDLTFTIKWPWAQSDADHSCVQQAIEAGSCLSRGVIPQFPVVCRDRDYYNSSLTEFDFDFQGPA